MVDPDDPTLEAHTSPEGVSATVEHAGTVLAGRYELLGLLGVGGMGAVYRAHDRELDEEVALKMLRPAFLASAGALARFRREVKIARRVTHRNVARTFDIGQDGTSRFLTMELIDGPSLGRRLEDGGALGVEEALRVAREICDGLEAAHAVGVVHRDLKPDNVLLADDRVVVTDFGIARIDRGDGGATGAAIVGTPAYMAPEQVLGQPADARADLYALGLVLFEMLVGRRAFDGDTPLGVAAARLVEPPPDLLMSSRLITSWAVAAFLRSTSLPAALSVLSSPSTTTVSAPKGCSSSLTLVSLSCSTLTLSIVVGL